MCLCVAWSVSVCYHLPCKCSPLSFHVRTCSHSTNVVSECDGSINVFVMLCRPEWQWKCALFYFKAYFARLGVGLLTLDYIGPQSPKCDLQDALIYVLCQVDMLCFPHVLVSIRMFIQFGHIIDLIEATCGKVVFFASYFCCPKCYVTSLTVSNGLVNCRASKCI